MRNPVALTLSVLVVIAAVIFGIVPGFAWITGFESTDGGHVAVVRNGGPFDDTTIQQVLPANSPRTSTGLFSSVHPYPTSGRFYDVTPGGDDSPTSVAFRTPTADGVDVGLTARFNFDLDTSDQTGPHGEQSVIRAFDNAYGVRQFDGVKGGQPSRLYPWEGDEGFEAFLSAIAKPVIEATIRQQIGNVPCVQLYASCALVENPNATVDPGAGTNSATLQKIQDAIDTAFVDNVNNQLGGKYFTAVKVSITGVDINSKIRDQITNAQAARAQVAVSLANVQQATADAQANENKQLGYNSCTTCATRDLIIAQGDALAKLPSNVTVYAPGGNAGINIAVPTK